MQESELDGSSSENRSESLHILLFGVHPRDPITFMVASTLLVAVALVAATLPARRAARADPVRALMSG